MYWYLLNTYYGYDELNFRGKDFWTRPFSGRVGNNTYLFEKGSQHAVDGAYIDIASRTYTIVDSSDIKSWGWRGDSNAGEYALFERLWCSETQATNKRGVTVLNTTKIKGKRTFKTNVNPNKSWSRISIPINFSVGGQNFSAMRFCNGKSTSLNITSGWDWNASCDRVQFIKPDGTLGATPITTIGWNSELFEDGTIDFGTISQEIPTFFYNWLIENTTEPKTAKIIIKEGDTTLVESPMIPPYTSIILATVGNRTTLTTNNGDEITFDTKDNFSGLSESKIALYPTIRDGTTTYFANTGEVTFYTCYKPSKPLPSNFLCSFYRCDAEENRVDKTDYLSDKQDFYITLKDEAPILGMSIFLDLTNINMNWDIPKWNYCYLHKFNRWYFCELKSVYNNVWEFKLSEDVLMSFKDQISGLQGMVDRNQSIFDRDIPDDLILTKAYPVIEHNELSPLQDIFKPDNEMNDYLNYLIILRG